MKDKIRILVADDEAKIRELVRMYLEREGFEVDEAGDGQETIEKIGKGKFHLVILDIMMPNLDGLTVCREIRRTMDIPIILLTARGEEVDRVLGFELGADDYVVKPFSPRELVARVKALLRRTLPDKDHEKQNVITYPQLTINQDARQVLVGNKEISLTPKEFDLLVLLASHPGKVFSRETILEKVWGYDFYGDLRTVDTHIKNLREKLRSQKDTPQFIHTVWGVGYKFEVNQP
ncbi:response regulator transcription factor [Calderihabitans maritimus]|uniref:response regulator transcription factor n=1 Tax=Calderihabitans maritimus TaxID=1246530 RepID=UPI0023535915|nr:response regulator transcription factor [Calderihabitans maritimus]